jgi:hypothetical protein
MSEETDKLKPSGVPPIGTMTATSYGRDYSLGARRSLESPAGRAERLARRYIRKFGDSGRAAAADLLKEAGAMRLGTTPLRTQPGVGKEAELQKGAEESAVRAGEEAKKVEQAATGGGETEETEKPKPTTVNPKSQPGAGSGKPLQTSSVSTTPSGLDFLRSPDEVAAKVVDSRKKEAERKAGRLGAFIPSLEKLMS